MLHLGNLVLATTLAVQASGDRTAEALSEARALINAGKAAAAIERLKPEDQSDPRVAHLLGVAHYHANDAARAVELLTVALRLPDGSFERREAVQVLGLAKYLTGRIAEAIPYLEETRTWAPHNLELGYALGLAYVQTRQPAPARRTFARMFRVEPESAAAHLLAAQMMIRVEQEDLAGAELQEALRKDPRLPHANYLLGQTAIFRARYDEAIALLERELAVNPAHAMALYRLGDAYGRQLRWDESIAALQKSIWLNPYFSGPYILLGRAYQKKNQPDLAEGMLRRAIGYDPNNRTAHYLLAQVLQHMGREDEARKEFAIAEKLQELPDRR